MPSLFIDNLPQGFSSRDLRELFGNHRYIADAYVPKIQRSRSNGRFGFIEVQAWEEGERLIQQVDGRRAGARSIKVDWAKYPRHLGKPRKLWHSARGEGPSNGHFKEQKTSHRHLEKSARVIKVEAVQENLEWLGRSLTCCSEAPRDTESLRREINEAFQEQIVVRDLGHHKFLITMDSKETKDRLKIEGKVRLEQWFYSFSDWVESDVCQTRRTWLEIVGLPIQFWSEVNIRSIATNWGDVVMVDKESSTLESLASAKVLIDTLSMYQIEEEAIIQVEGKGFKVFVFEAKTDFTIFHIGSLGEGGPGSVSPKINGNIGIHPEGGVADHYNQDEGNGQKNVDGDQIDGVEGQTRADSGGGGSCLNLNLHLNSDSLSPRTVDQLRGYHSEADTALIKVDANRGICEEDLIEGRVDGVLERSPILIAAGTEGVEQRNVNTHNEAASQASSTRTKTAQLSDIACSVEAVEINQILAPQTQNTQVDGFGVDVNQSKARHAQTESDDSVPPGFEDRAARKGIIGRKGKAKRRHTNPEEGIRVTRSQLRKARTKAAGHHSAVNRFSPCERKSFESTESMKQLAEEALKVGELLGVKVISHRANAVKRITDSLKANRATSLARV